MKTSEKKPGNAAAPEATRAGERPSEKQVAEKETAEKQATDKHPAERQSATGGKPAPVEIGGRKGPEPTRYGDWEKNGIISDF